MRFFPIFTNLQEQTVFLQGYSHHALEKIEKLLPYGAIIRVFTENGLEEYKDHPQIILEGRRMQESDLDQPPVFVVTADIPREDAEEIFRWCIQRNIHINSVDVPDLCTFYFPALITKGSFTLSISTSGKSPAAASLMRKQLEPQIPIRIVEILEWSESLRNQLKLTHPDPKQRRTILKNAVSLAMELDRPLTTGEVNAII